MYRNFKYFAQGRNCSVEWNLKETEDKTDWVQTTFIPNYTIPEINPRKPTEEIKQSLNIKVLSEITNYEEYSNLLYPITEAYEDWINGLEDQNKVWENDDSITCFEKNFISNKTHIPRKRIEECIDALERIKDGINKISNDPLIGESFRFANEVMYQSITHTKWAKTNKDKVINGQAITEDGPNSKLEPEWAIIPTSIFIANSGINYQP